MVLLEAYRLDFQLNRLNYQNAGHAPSVQCASCESPCGSAKTLRGTVLCLCDPPNKIDSTLGDQAYHLDHQVYLGRKVAIQYSGDDSGCLRNGRDLHFTATR